MELQTPCYAGVSWLNLGMLQMNVCAYVCASCSNLGMLQMKAAVCAIMLQERHLLAPVSAALHVNLLDRFFHH